MLFILSLPFKLADDGQKCLYRTGYLTWEYTTAQTTSDELINRKSESQNQ